MNAETRHVVVSLNSKSQFTLDETNDLLVIINKITKKHQESLSDLLQLVDQESDPVLKVQLKLESQKVVNKWNSKVEKLGGRPSGVWFADFDFGRGYFCWKYPERQIGHWHKYTEGFSKRKPIADL